MIVIIILGYLIGLFLLLLALYATVSFIGAVIPWHRNYQPVHKGIDIFLSSNGYHTDFILPSNHPLFNWSAFLGQHHFKIANKNLSFIGIGWGDKAIHLDIKEWSELTFTLGWNSLFKPTPTILHITAYQALPSEENKIFKTCISKRQYLQLCDFILAHFKEEEKTTIQPIKRAGYTDNDIFFEANGKYHAFNTCNTWINKGLKRIGVRTTLWTTLDRGLFYQLQKSRRANDPVG